MATDSGPTPSLIQQRHALNRQRLAAILSGVAAVCFAAIGVADVFVEPEHRWWGWLYVVVGVAWGVQAVGRWAKFLRARDSFEHTHGPTAGQQ